MFRVGDKVTQIRNNYDKGQAGVFNGTVGLVTAQDPDEQTLIVRTDDVTRSAATSRPECWLTIIATSGATARPDTVVLRLLSHQPPLRSRHHRINACWSAINARSMVDRLVCRSRREVAAFKIEAWSALMSR